MQKLIVFRVDASIETGTGHVMRCAALAAALRKGGAEIVFLCRQLPDGYRDMLADNGFTVTMLAADGPFDVNDDARETIAALRFHGRPDWLIVDHYGLGVAWEQQHRPHVGHIMVVDDLADRPHDCDLLLDQNHYTNAEDRYRGLVPAECRLLLGPHFALLRTQFAEARKSRRRRDGVVTRLLICFGGSDAENLTARAIDAFLAAELPELTAEVLIGGANPHWPALASRYGSLRSVQLHRNVGDVAALMAHVDLFLGAGGSMTWERAAVGLPGLTVAVAANQEPLCVDIETMGGGVHLGNAATATEETIIDALRLLVCHPNLLHAFGERLAALTDGRGAARVARLLAPPTILLRQAVQGDCDQLHAWRNDPETRRYSGDGAPIPLEAHRAWFTATIANSSRILLVGQRVMADGCIEPVGVLRYDLEGSRATISIYLVPGLSGGGWGSALIKTGDEWLSDRYPEITHIDARVRADNQSSLGVFAAADYTPEASLLVKCLATGV